MNSGTESTNQDITLGRLFGQLDAKNNLDVIFQAIADGVTVQDENGSILYANDAAAKIVGYENHQELMAVDPKEIMQNFDLLDEFQKPFPIDRLPGRLVFKNNQSESAVVCWCNRSTGEQRWSEVKARPIQDADGNVRYAVNVFRDITEQLRITQEFERTNRRNHHILESITDGFFALDKNWKFTYVNKQAEQLMGRSRSELIGKNIFEEFPKAVQSETYRKFQEALSRNESLRFEERFWGSNTRSGQWIESSVYPARDGFAVYLRDITPQKFSEEANHKLAAIVQSSEDAIIGKSLDGTITSWNRGAAKIYGYAEDEIVGKNISVLVPPGRADDSQYLIDQIKSGQSVEHYETKRINKSGRIIDVSITVSPIRGPEGQIVGASAVARDITEAKRAKEAQDFLSEASSLLSSSLEYETTLARVAQLVVPKFADWCAIEILTPGGSDTKRVAVTHVDPDKVRFAYEVAKKYPSPKNPAAGLWKVITTSKSEIYPEITDEMIRQGVASQEHYEMLSRLGLKSVIMVPLVARGKVFGVISLFWAESGQRYEPKDVLFFEELGRRAGIAIDNAILYREAQAEIQERKFMEQKLQISEEHYRTLIENTSDGVALLKEDGKLSYATKAIERMLGYDQDELVGMDVFSLIHTDDLEIVSKLFALVKAQPARPVTAQYRCLDKKGYYRWIEGAATNLLNHPTIKSIVVNFRDISERRKAEETLQYQYHHDALTDLPNRTYLSEQFEWALENTADRKCVALILIDLDRFKQINESLGHAVGDRLIQEVALRLRSSIMDSHVLARLGGDEFGIIIPDVETEEEIAQASNKILDEFKPPFYLDKHELYISPSIGISIFPYDGREPAVLFRNAEAALYRAKEYGRNTYQFYTRTMNASAYERLTLESKLRHAIENNELVLFYQPQIEVSTGKVVGAEELIRWQRPDSTLIPPDRFIPLAEANGLIEPIGEFALRESLRQAKIWHDQGFKLMIAINLSPRQFKQKNFERLLVNIIDESKIDPHFVELELTESVLAENPEVLFQIMNALRERGVRFCLDDFSTGYSTLKYIKQFPVDMLKIERNFIKGIPLDVQNSAIAKSILTLGQSLGLEVTAEGVESKNQLAFLRDHLCNRAQGYLFNGAMPAHSLSEILGEDRYVSVVANLGKVAPF